MSRNCIRMALAMIAQLALTVKAGRRGLEAGFVAEAVTFTGKLPCKMARNFATDLRSLKYSSSSLHYPYLLGIESPSLPSLGRYKRALSGEFIGKLPTTE